MEHLLAVTDCACHRRHGEPSVGVSQSLCPSPISLDPSLLTVTVFSKPSGSSERPSRGKEEQVAEDVAEWALSGTEATDATGGSRGRLFPEHVPDEPDLGWKGPSR